MSGEPFECNRVIEEPPIPIVCLVELLDLVLELAHLLAGVLPDGPAAEARGQHADAVGALGVEGAVDGALRQRRDDQ